MAYDRLSYEALAGFQNPIIDRQAAEIERVKADYNGLFKLYNDQSAESRTLRARVEELEANLSKSGTAYWALQGERDALREDARNFSNLFDQLNAKYLALRAELRREKACREGAESNSKWAAEEVLRLRAELESVRSTEETAIEEVLRLKAELAALKPVPVVVTHYDHVVDMGDCLACDSRREPNIKYIFTDGKLTGAEVLRGEG